MKNFVGNIVFILISIEIIVLLLYRDSANNSHLLTCSILALSSLIQLRIMASFDDKNQLFEIVGLCGVIVWGVYVMTELLKVM